MIKIYDYQFDIYANKKLQKFIDELLNHYRKIAPPYLPSDESEQVKLLHNKIKETNQYGFQTDDQIEQFVYIVLNYKEMQEKEYDDAIKQILNWPDRSPERIIEELTDYLIRKNLKI